MSDPLQVGSIAPNFVCVDQSGNKHELAQYKGKKVILFFYPRASTPGCTDEACNLRDNHDTLVERGFVVLGASADKKQAQNNFKSKKKLPFNLLADEEKNVLKAYNAWGIKKFMGKTSEGVLRKTFIIDEEGVVSHIIDKVKTKDHTQQILDLISEDEEEDEDE